MSEKSTGQRPADTDLPDENMEETRVQTMCRELIQEEGQKLDALLATPSALASEKLVDPGVNLRAAMRHAFDFFADESAEGREKRKQLRAKIAAGDQDETPLG